jgi:uncharacterized cupin superfamily protein
MNKKKVLPKNRHWHKGHGNGTKKMAGLTIEKGRFHWEMARKEYHRILGGMDGKIPPDDSFNSNQGGDN